MRFSPGKVDLEDISFLHCVWEVAFPAAVMFKRRTNVPANLAVDGEGRTSLTVLMGDDLGTGRGHRGAVEIEVSK
jgi:hypothetical protein